MSNFTEMDCYLFGQATHYDIYRKMGAHKMTIEGEEGVCFDVWAPHADRVYVIGEFNGWNETSHEMKRVTPRRWAYTNCLYRASRLAVCTSS